MLYFFMFILFLFLFIFGMTVLRTGLFNLSAQSLRSWLTKLTDKAWKGLIVGTIITMVLQSSSAVMVITIGLISAKMISFPQSIGIILGTNIGTSVTTEIITFNIDPFLIPLFVLGAALLLSNHSRICSIGLSLFGIAAVFTAMRGFKKLADPLASLPFVTQIFQLIDHNHFLSVIVGSFITAIIQSSTALTGIVMGFLSSAALNVDTGIALMLGSNIGTCMTAFIASIGAGREAKLCAYAHIWLNILGVILFFPFINHLTVFTSLATDQLDVQLAHSSVIFNLISSLIVLPFAHRFGKFILAIHKK
ncbi:Na/Pi cotransporter family protein [Bacillus aquiflavi]|uniref:Na/Pi cotransporter family protein n=1 Tax=Bacillus aquiflavi TaxID=2672567 RepID=A0A6B3VY22_9BACI|nr:Na/Pi symporter [Bacillus aquiflavi]MBA4535879.1 Na/Pi cotransporter family protein [Bacillus aquiflavi]NEY80254.1 Na/Pi cotransporter family protein [Bacillus aquiflavi]UAC47299.1 Na/Pi symporter [Bacillus aquiflavi]